VSPSAVPASLTPPLYWSTMTAECSPSAPVSTAPHRPRPPGRGGPQAFDPSVPNVARIYDYLLRGKDNYACRP